ncbi:MAG TPA: Ig-like domain-containing protein, partial [Prosthecobacter sp.]
MILPRLSILTCSLALAAVLPLPLSAQVSFPGSYSQNFDTLGTGTNLASLTGWSQTAGLGGTNSTWTNSTGIPASGTTSAATAGTVNNTLTVNSNAASATATSNSAGFNFALSASTGNRCIGTSPTSGAGSIFQLRLTNNSGGALNGVRISYDIRRFTVPATANEVPGYRLFYSTDNGSTWTNASALNPALTGASVNVPNTAGVTSVPLTTLNFATPLAIGGDLRFRWVDDNATETSPDQIIGLDNVVVQALQPPPTVALTEPVAEASFALPTSINLAATAADSNGTVTKVEFYANGSTKIGEDTSEPYEFAWSGMISGSYSLTAKATDNDGDSTTSAAVGITVTNPVNQAPTAAITSPAQSAL